MELIARIAVWLDPFSSDHKFHLPASYTGHPQCTRPCRLFCRRWQTEQY